MVARLPRKPSPPLFHVVVALFLASSLLQSLFAQDAGSWDEPAGDWTLEESDGRRHVAGEILVGYEEQSRELVLSHGMGTLAGEIPRLRVLKLKLKEGEDAREAARRASSLPGVVYAEPNLVGKGGVLHVSPLPVPPPDDTFFSSQYHLQNTGQSGGTPGADIDILSAWDVETGNANVRLAVLDTGIDFLHPEFLGRTSPGYDYVNEDADPTADHPHGIHVTGLAAAHTNNTFQVSGVDPSCTIEPVKVLNQNNVGTVFDLAQGLDHCAAQQIDVVNMSLVDYMMSNTLTNAISNARAAGCILVGCAGNGGIGDADQSWPGASPDVISVGATDDRDQRASFSGTGGALDFVTPGVCCYTTPDVWTDSAVTFTGCSASAPLASGIVSLLKARCPGLTHDRAYELLRVGAEDEVGLPSEDVPGRDDYHGYGRLDARAALEALVACDPERPMSTLEPGDLGQDDRFGRSVDVGATVAVVGARMHDAGLSDAGAAYVFRHAGAAFVQEHKLLASDRQAGDAFGTAVAVHGAVILVGADQDDDLGADSGSAYVFRYQGGAWKEEAKLLASDGAAGDEFGFAVALDTDVAVVSARSADAAGSDSGAVYVFRHSGGSWIEEQKLLAADTAPGDQLGSAVATRPDLLLVGARHHDAVGSEAGAAYVFRRAGGVWQEVAKLLPAALQAGDELGFSVGLDGARAAVGAWRSDLFGADSGAVFLFEEQAGVWMETHQIGAADTLPGDRFGSSVSLENDLLAVGAQDDDGGGRESGGAFLFRLSGAGWREQPTLEPDDLMSNDLLGRSIALGSSWAIAGATGHDGVAPEAGAAYVFEAMPMGLFLDPEEVRAGDRLRFRLEAGLPLTPIMLFVLDVNAIPVNMLLFSFPLNVHGELHLQTDVPPGLSGMAPTFLGLGVSRAGLVTITNVECVQFQ